MMIKEELGCQDIWTVRQIDRVIPKYLLHLFSYFNGPISRLELFQEVNIFHK